MLVFSEEIERGFYRIRADSHGLFKSCLNKSAKIFFNPRNLRSISSLKLSNIQVKLSHE